MPLTTEQDQVVEELAQADKLLLTTHANPDGDALGSLLSMHWTLEQLGTDSVMHMSPGEFPLPYEHREMTCGRTLRAPPEHLEARPAACLDRPDRDRKPPELLQ